MCTRYLILFASLCLIVAPGLAQTISFQAPQTIPLNGAGPVTVADFNGDGKPDLLTLSLNRMVILFGNGDGTFQAPSYIGTAGVNAVTVGDFNGDGKPDLAARIISTFCPAAGAWTR